MNDVEQRLRSALNARAELVQPEDLNLDPVLEPSEPDPTPWWRHPSAYLFVAAVLVILIALPLLALAATNPDGGKEPLQPANSSDSETMTDPVPAPFDQAGAEVDGDGIPDRVRVMSAEAPDAVLADYWITVDLTESGKTATYDLGRATAVKLGATSNLDGRRGEEIVVAVDPETVDLHRAAPVVISLRDGELVSILADPRVTSGTRGADGTRTHWWVHDGQLWWWHSQEPVSDGDDSAYAVDVLRFPREATLRGVDHGTWCVTSLAATRLLDCGA